MTLRWSDVTPEAMFLNRRAFMAGAAAVAIGVGVMVILALRLPAVDQRLRSLINKSFYIR